MTYRLLLLLTLLAPVGLGGCGAGEPAAPPPTPLPSTLPADTLPTPTGLQPADAREAPDLTLRLIGGDSLRLHDLRGRVVLVNFWATWCPPCRVEIPDLIALHEEMHAAGLTVLGIALDEEGADVVGPFAEALAIPYPIALDDGTAANAFGGVFGLPMSFVIDARGRIVHRALGLFPVDTMRPVLRDLLAGTAPAEGD